jgi:lipopolysaccharide export system protein LptA
VARDHPELHNPNDNADVSLSADELAAPLGPGGQPERVIATGHALLKARRAGGQDQLEAAWSDLELIPDTQQPRHLTATGDVVVQSSLPDGSSRRLQTPALEVYFVSPDQGESRIERVTALPGTVEWQDSLRGSASRQAESMRLTGRHLDGAFGQSEQLRELRATGGVEVQRRMGGGPPMISTSRELLARMGPDGAWSSVDQSGDVRLKNSTGDAQGDRARFERASETVALSGSVILSDASSRTRAQSATFRQGANELRAEGNVTTSEVSPAPGDAGGISPEPAHVSSDHLVVDTASGHAVYSGKARLWQGDSVIQADTLDLDRAKRTLIATGNVRAVFPQVRQTPPPGAGAGPGPAQRQVWRAEAGRMIYEEGERRARLERGARAHSAEGSMRADRMDLFFAPQSDSPGPASGGRGSTSANPGPRAGLGMALAGQELERAAGFGAVRVESGERTGTAERADYEAAAGKFVLSGGRPALMDLFGNATTGRQLTFFLADDKIVVDSEEGSRTLTLHRVEK